MFSDNVNENENGMQRTSSLFFSLRTQKDLGTHDDESDPQPVSNAPAPTRYVPGRVVYRRWFCP